MSAGKLNTGGANSAVISSLPVTYTTANTAPATYTGMVSTYVGQGAAQAEKSARCKHRWAMWDMPMIVGQYEHFNESILPSNPVMIQYRQCLECGEARARNVKY